MWTLPFPKTEEHWMNAPQMTELNTVSQDLDAGRRSQGPECNIYLSTISLGTAELWPCQNSKSLQDFFNRFSKVWTMFNMQFLYQIQLANSLIIVIVSVHIVLWSVLQINITWNFTQKNQELLKISNLFTLIINGAFESLLSRVCVKQETWKDNRILTFFFCFIPIITGQLSVIFLLLKKHRLKLSTKFITMVFFSCNHPTLNFWFLNASFLA